MDKNNTRNDLEQVFVDAVEEVRKEIIRRRLKNEITQRNLTKKAIEGLAEKDFGVSLVKLADIVQ